MRSPRPNFLIIGAQKCGTTWLFEQLRQHPDIFMPEVKDLEFFSYHNHLTKPGFSGYLQHFSEAADKRAVGEATASYFWTRTNSRWGVLPTGFQPDIPSVVHQYLGEELRLIVTLRNPVRRVISAYLHYLAVGEIPPHTGFNRAIKYGGVVDMGFYACQLRNWLEHYPIEKIKVLILESDIQDRPTETLSAVCGFLSISDHEFNQESLRQVVFSGPRRVINENGVYVPGNGSAAEKKDSSYLNVDGQNWHRIISAEQLDQLHDIFRPDVKDLDRLLGTNLVQSWGFAT
jgi:hypothetical protein